MTYDAFTYTGKVKIVNQTIDEPSGVYTPVKPPIIIIT